MLIDLQKFIVEERPYWVELEKFIDTLENEPEHRLDLAQLERFHYLYQRASSDLARLMTFSAEPNTRLYLESLVGRAYGEIHESRDQTSRFSFIRWFFSTFPQTFRKHIRAFWLSLAAMAVGCALGGFLITVDPASKSILMPFPHLQGDPSERVAQEEAVTEDRVGDAKASFSSYLMTHNTRVSIFTLALGISWGIGTALMLFYNGVILGAVFLDYVTAGESLFLFGWLLPHGAIEIPSILLAGQAGFVLASAIVGWGRSVSLKMRLRMVTPDLVTLICGVAAMLLWAGIIEAFFSQYHEPLIPYGIKVGFGILELFLLALFLTFSGREPQGDSKIAFTMSQV